MSLLEFKNGWNWMWSAYDTKMMPTETLHTQCTHLRTAARRGRQFEVHALARTMLGTEAWS